MKYDDAMSAIDWLCDTFAFSRRLVVTADDGSVVHAQLVCQDAMIMLSDSGDSEFDQWQKTPSQVGGVGTQSAYIVVDDIDVRYQRCLSADAQIVMPLRDEDHGGQSFSCRDPQGHLWNFGTYDPWTTEHST